MPNEEKLRTWFLGLNIIIYFLISIWIRLSQDMAFFHYSNMQDLKKQIDVSAIIENIILQCDLWYKLRTKYFLTFYSSNTIKKHLKNWKATLGAHTITQAYYELNFQPSLVFLLSHIRAFMYFVSSYIYAEYLHHGLAGTLWLYYFVKI